LRRAKQRSNCSARRLALSRRAARAAIKRRKAARRGFLAVAGKEKPGFFFLAERCGSHWMDEFPVRKHYIELTPPLCGGAIVQKRPDLEPGMDGERRCLLCRRRSIRSERSTSINTSTDSRLSLRPKRRPRAFRKTSSVSFRKRRVSPSGCSNGACRHTAGG